MTKVDFLNTAIRTSYATFPFHKGTALNNDDPPGEDSRPDWKAEIVSDSVIRPAPDVAVRFLLIYDDHLTGSCCQYIATGFICSDGKMREVFHRNGISLDVDRLDSTMIGVRLNTVPGKPIRKHFSYPWDRATSKYVLSSAQ